MPADLTQVYTPLSTFGVISRNTINGGVYPIAGALLPRLSQGIFVRGVTNSIITDNTINNISNAVLELHVCRGCSVASNKLTNCGSEGASIALVGCQQCVVTDNNIHDENYPNGTTSPDIEEYDENGAYNGDIPVTADYNFVYANTLSYYPFVIPGAPGSTMQERRAFINLSGPNSRAFSNILQGHMMDLACIQNITELASCPFPGTRNAAAPILVYVAGLTSPSDGGAAIWKWDPTSTATVNNYSVVGCNLPIPPSTTTGRWLKQTQFLSLTTSARTALSLTNADAGALVYDATLNAFYYWNGSLWTELGATGGGSIVAEVDSIGTAQIEGVTARNTTAAATGAQQWGPVIISKGKRWTGSASQEVGWGWQATSDSDGTDAGQFSLFADVAGTLTKILNLGRSALFGAGYTDLQMKISDVLTLFNSTHDGVSLAASQVFTYIAGNAVLTTTSTKHSPANDGGLYSGTGSTRWAGVSSYWYESKADSTITAAATITPTTGLSPVSGATSIATIATTYFNPSLGTNPTWTCVAAGGTVTFVTGGNVAVGVTVAAGMAQDFVYSSADSLWHPKQ